MLMKIHFIIRPKEIAFLPITLLVQWFQNVTMDSVKLKILNINSSKNTLTIIIDQNFEKKFLFV